MFNKLTMLREDSGGFTLVEMMIALLVFGVGVVAMAQVLPQGIEMRDRGRRMSVATSLAREQIELLRSARVNSPDLAAGTHQDPANPVDGAYRRSWVVQENTPLPGMRRIEVTVSFMTSGPDSVAQVTTQLPR